jgi:structural maintenance of chromosome 2
VAKSLLDSGKLSKRVTIIPLNKIVPKSVPPEKIKIAKEIDRQSQVAISLVGYEASLEAAMQYIFGGTFICEGTI